jgi:hypothetical protein
MDKLKSKQNALIVFVKSPHLGQVKTRMQPELSTEVSLNLHKFRFFYSFLAGKCTRRNAVVAGDEFKLHPTTGFRFRGEIKEFIFQCVSAKLSKSLHYWE